MRSRCGLSSVFFDHLLPGRVSDGGGGVPRSNSELDFRADSLRYRGQYSDDGGFDRHRSLTSLRGADNFVEQNFTKTSVSRRTGALLEVSK